MDPLEIKDNIPHINGKEVLIYPIRSVEIRYSYQERATSIEDIITSIMEDPKNQTNNLRYANSYLCSKGIEIITSPEEQVMDGKISESRLRCLSINFYKAVPATLENKIQVKDIFGLDIESYNEIEKKRMNGL